MRDLSKQELEFYQGRQDVVLDQAKTLATSFDGTAEEYEICPLELSKQLEKRRKLLKIRLMNSILIRLLSIIHCSVRKKNTPRNG